MAELIAKGQWVEIHRIVLPAGERAAQIPEDTKRVPLEVRVKGFLVAAAVLGADAEIVTRAGRRLRGTLAAVNPAYTHSFGPPLAELSAIGEEVRAVLRMRGRVQ
jgi:2-amino-4-ketopentanoate thiolase alpha subunit